MPDKDAPVAELSLALIGFGEAAQAFLGGMGDCRPAALFGFDIKVAASQAEVRRAKAEDFARHGVASCATNAEAVATATAVFSLVTAGNAAAAAAETARTLGEGALFFDANSVAPHTKLAAAAIVEAAQGRYVDMAIMSPVHPAGVAAPILLSGPHAEAGAAVLAALGFSKVRVLAQPVGAASAVKMIRSIMVKGVEALTAECLMAATAAGVDHEVLASLDASDKRDSWVDRGDYNLDRMMVHGVRRSEEMREVVLTLENLHVPAAMTRGAVAWQAAIGEAGLSPPPAGYLAKTDLIRKTGALP